MLLAQWIDGHRKRAASRRHSGKGRAVPERCLSIQGISEATPYQIIARSLGVPRCCRSAIQRMGEYFLPTLIII
jgi:hypothetical protein